MIWLLTLTGCSFVDAKIDAPYRPGDAAEVEFTVPAGSSARGIGGDLVDAGVVGDARMWGFYLRWREAGSCLKAGRFLLSPSMSMPEVMETLCGAPLPEDEPFTVVEGWRIREIDAALVEKGWSDAGAYAAAAADPGRFTLPAGLGEVEHLEGLLFPETYAVEPHRFTVDAFIQRQIDTLVEAFATPNADALDARGLYPLIIMASMLEREEPAPKNRPMVAGILWKRLDEKWNLGVDATSRYTLKDWNDRRAFLKKLRDPSDVYNTRKRGGLPPTPIGNPGLGSLEAALHPVGSEYYYYLHDAQGRLHPARNGREHEANRARYNVY